DVDVLLGVLEEKNQPLSFRNAAAQVLGILGPDAAQAVGRLGQIIGNRDHGDARVTAAYTLGDIGVPARLELAARRAALKQDDVPLQVAAATALGEIFAGTDNATVIEALREAARSPHENVAAAASAALKKVQGAGK